MIVFAPQAAGPLYRVRESGGEVVPVTVLDEKRQETGHRWPCFLPDGKHFLFVTLPAKQGNFDVFVGSIDSKERKFLFAASSAPIYAEPGYLIYMRDNTLVAQRFDAGGLATTRRSREPRRGAGAVGLDRARRSCRLRTTACSRAGAWGSRTRLCSGTTAPGNPPARFPCPPAASRRCGCPRTGSASPTVRRSAVSATDIWLFDLDRPVPSRFTFGPSTNYYLAWSPDGSRIAFASDRFGPEDIFVKSVDGAAEETAVLKGGALFKEPSSWSADGKTIVFEQPDPKSGWDL